MGDYAATNRLSFVPAGRKHTCRMPATGRPAPTIVDLTDTIRVGIVEESIGDAAMKAFGINEVSMSSEMTFHKTTGRSTRICLSSQIGTHMDAGAHAEPDGWPVNDAPLDHLVVPGIVVDVRGKTDDKGVTSADLEKYDIQPGAAVLFLFTYSQPKPGAMFSQVLLDRRSRRMAGKAWCTVRGQQHTGTGRP